MKGQFNFLPDFLDNSSYGILVLKDGVILESNFQGARMLGFDKNSIVTKPVSAIFNLDFIDELQRIEAKSNFPFVFNWNCDTNGSRRIFEVEISRMMVGDDQLMPVTFRDITSKENLEKILKSRIRILELSEKVPLPVILRNVLDELEQLTQSKIGFVHFLMSDQKTILSQAWSTNTANNYCKIPNSNEHYNLEQAGIWCDCIRERKPIIHNDYNTAKNKKGLPAGHVPIIRELVVPIFRNGKIVAVVGVGNKETDYNGRDIEIVQQFADLTWEIAERKISEENFTLQAQKLKTSEANFKAFFNNSVVTLFAFDTNGNILMANEEASRMLGYKIEELQQMNIKQIHPQKYEAETLATFNEIVAGKRSICAIPMLSKSGVEIPVETRIGKSEWYGTEAFFCVSEDLTDLRISEEKFHTAFNRSGIAMAIVNVHDLVCAEVNDKFLEYTFFSREELIGKNIVSAIKVSDSENRASVLDELSLKKSIHDRTVSFTKKNGVIGKAIVNISYMWSQQGEFFIVAANDITDKLKAEEQLIESKENFESFFENSIEILFVLDNSGKILKANNEALRVLEYDEDEIVQLNIEDIHPAEYLSETKKALGQIFIGERDFCTIPLITKKGKYIPVETNVGRGMWDGVEAFYCISKDLTDLRISEEKFSKAFQSNGSIMALVTVQGFRFVEVNNKFTTVFGFLPEEIIGKNDEEIGIVVDSSARNQFVGQNNADGLEVEWYPIRSKFGQILYINFVISKINLLGVDYYLLTGQDVSEQKNTEEKLKDREVQLHQITENVQEGIILAKMDLSYVFVNKTFSDLTGFSKEDSLNLKISDIVVNADDLNIAYALRSEGGSISKNYVELRRKDGSTFFADISAKRILIGDNYYILGTQKDSTNQYKAEKELLRAYDEIQQLKNKLEEENFLLKQEIKKSKSFSEIITQNIIFHKTLNQIEIVAPTNASVLIHGETGTGKELVARAIHNLSDRKNMPMVKVNCAAIPDALIESELFGHEKGAFTGAIERKQGRFELASGGTLFLDEVGEMPLNLQSKLLRVLQEHEFERVGGVKTIKVNVRIIAATNRDLLKEVEEGRFRRDLFYRLNVVPITVPPLRERIDDIALLTNHFVAKFNTKFNKQISRISTTVMNTLLNYSWPGNVRELENLIERSVLLSMGESLDIAGWQKESAKSGAGNKLFVTFDEMQRKYIIDVLKHTNWRIGGSDGASEILDMKRTTLASKMQKLGIEKGK